MKIFWSWQSDRAQRVCREFVQTALIEAVPRVVAELDESDRPEVDHDTLGEPGLV